MNPKIIGALVGLVLVVGGVWLEGSGTVVTQPTVAQTSTTAAVMLYVDPAGDDRNGGLTAAAPLRTVNAALAKVPRKVQHTVTINLAAGTYAEDLSLAFDVLDIATIAYGHTFTIKGPALNTVPVIASGILRGLSPDGGATTFEYNVDPLDGGVWTPGAYANDILQVYNSTGYPIVNNSATSVELPLYNGTSRFNKAFAIVVPAASIVGSSSLTVPTVYSAGSGIISLQDLAISRTANTSTPVYVVSGKLDLTRCKITSSGDHTGVVKVGPGASIDIVYSSLSGASTGSALNLDNRSVATVYYGVMSGNDAAAFMFTANSAALYGTQSTFIPGSHSGIAVQGGSMNFIQLQKCKIGPAPDYGIDLMEYTADFKNIAFADEYCVFDTTKGDVRYGMGTVTSLAAARAIDGGWVTDPATDNQFVSIHRAAN